MLLTEPLLKEHCNSINIFNNHIRSEKLSDLPVFFYITVQIIFSPTINMQLKGSIKSLPLRGLLLAFYELMKSRDLETPTFKLP